MMDDKQWEYEASRRLLSGDTKDLGVMQMRRWMEKRKAQEEHYHSKEWRDDMIQDQGLDEQGESE